jgi:hypothetical protein
MGACDPEGAGYDVRVDPVYARSTMIHHHDAERDAIHDEL